MSFNVLVKMFFTGLLGIVALSMILDGGLSVAGFPDIGAQFMILAVVALLMYLCLKLMR